MRVRLVVLAAALALLTGTLAAQEKKKGGPPPGDPGMMGPQVTEQHKALQALAGKWNYVLKADMGGQTMEMKGAAQQEMIMGGLFLTTRVKSAEGEAMPFEGRGWYGYDTNKKAYIYVWIDSMATGVMRGEGTYDARAKTFTWQSEGFDPMQNRVVKGKETMEIKSADEIIHTFYRLDGGKESKMMVITSKRAK